jgi:Siphovirus Gp157
MTTPVANAARIVAELRERLKSEYGLDDGDEALETTLEGETGLPELLAMMARDAVQADDYAQAVGNRLGFLTVRKANLERRSVRLRNAIAWALQEAGWKRVPSDALPEMTATVSVREPVAEIHDEDDVPEEFCIIKKVSRPNKPLITERLKAGEKFDFAYLPNPKPVLTIRTK